MRLLVIDFWLAYRLLSLWFIICVGTYMHNARAHFYTQPNRWIAQASEVPTLGSLVTHSLSVLPSVPRSNKRQTPCKPCTKHDVWNQTWYHLHRSLRATLFHNYKTVRDMSSLKTSIVIVSSSSIIHVMYMHTLLVYCFSSLHLVVCSKEGAWSDTFCPMDTRVPM